MTQKLLQAADINFDNAIQVISSSQKFIIPIPQSIENPEKLIYPLGTKDKNGNLIENMPILDWQGNPIGNFGILFFNGTDNSWQAALDDGNSVIIINQITMEQANIISDFILNLQNKKINTQDIHLILDFIKNKFNIVDMYNSTIDFVKKKMIKIDNQPYEFGLFRRYDTEPCLAIMVHGNGQFSGPAATPQVFKNNAIIVKDKTDIALVQTEIFLQTYIHINGDIISINDIHII